MIAPGILASVAHMTRIEGRSDQPIHQEFLVIRAPEIGFHACESARLLSEDFSRDISLLEIRNPRSTTSVTLESELVTRGTSCGSLGFPISHVFFDTDRRFMPQARAARTCSDTPNQSPNQSMWDETRVRPS